MAGYRDLVAWQRAMKLANDVYEASERWPKAEQFAMTSQCRRAAVSIAANIAEGQGRSGRREFRHHLSIAYGSLCELETILELARMRTYLDESTESKLRDAAAEVARLLKGLLRSMKDDAPNESPKSV